MNRNTLILLLFVLAKFVLQYLLIDPGYDLHRDEYLHLDQGDHLAWGYLSVPPLTSWLSYLVKLMGNSVYAVKFFPALFGALTIVVVWKTIEALKGNLFALVLGATCVLLSALVRINFLYQPNSADILCWTSVYFFLIRYIGTRRAKWLFFGSIVFGLGFLNKYNIVFQAMGLLPAILLTPQRKLLLRREMWIAAILALALIMPNLLWQYQNNFPVLHHMKELADTQLVNVSRAQFLKEQLLYFMAALPVIAASLYALFFYEPFRQYRLFFWSLIFTLIAFMWFRAKGYYAIGIYPIYIGFGSVFLGDVLRSGAKRLIKPVLITIPVVFFILFFKIGFSMESPEGIQKNREAYSRLGLLRWEDGKDHRLPQDIADMLGWRELALKVDKAINSLPPGTNTLVLCDNYGQAGAINYYSANRHMNAVSFNADYINWFRFDKLFENVIRVKELRNRDGELKETGAFFDRALVADSVANPLAREYRTTIFVFGGAKADLRQRVKIEVEELKWH